MQSFVYNLLLICALPSVSLWYLWRILITKKSNKSWRGNLGAIPSFADRPKNRKLVWLHAASVGEVVSILPVLKELRALLPDGILVLTTITQTGNSMARKAATDADAIGYFPLDYPITVNRALDRLRPDVFVMVEVELWPNVLDATARRGVPSVLINGRVSDRSYRRFRWFAWLMSWAVSHVDYGLMQTATDAERIKDMGAKKAKIDIVGSSKFDQEGGRLTDESVSELRRSFGLAEGIPVFVAGSTNPGEDEIVLNAYESMKASMPRLRLIIAPRQIERSAEIFRKASAKGFSCVYRKSDVGSDSYDVLVLNSFGELASVYALAMVTFVGGSLIPKGGHSLIQPILQGKPVLFGPYTFKTRDVAQTALRVGVGFEVTNAETMSDKALKLFQDENQRRAIDEECWRLVAENMGASRRCAEVIARIATEHVENTSA